MLTYGTSPFYFGGYIIYTLNCTGDGQDFSITQTAFSRYLLGVIVELCNFREVTIIIRTIVRGGRSVQLLCSVYTLYWPLGAMLRYIWFHYVH